MVNEKYDAEILQICLSSVKLYPLILKSKRFKYLWNYILSCTLMLQDKEIETGHKYRVSTFVNWTLKHRACFGQCKTCGKSFELCELSFNGEYQQFCSTACMNKDPGHIKAVGDTLERKYGKRIPAQIPLFFLKMGDTCEKLYGVRNCWLLDKVVEKQRSPESIAHRLESLKRHNQEHYGVDWFVQSDEFKEKTKITNGTSKEEKALVEWLKTFVSDDDIAVGTFKVIYPQQLDVYIPSKKIAIEFNGTYYHSIEHNTDVLYHLKKTLRCEELGIHLMHIWENEWTLSNDEVKSFIKAAIDGTLHIDAYIKKRDDGLFEVDRSKLNKCAIPSCYDVVAETEPLIVVRAKSQKDKYKVPDCGTLILRQKALEFSKNCV